MREIISTKDAPQAIGPYSQAIKANGFVFVSGQVAIDPATQLVIAGDVAAQTDEFWATCRRFWKPRAVVWVRSCARRCFSRT